MKLKTRKKKLLTGQQIIIDFLINKAGNVAKTAEALKLKPALLFSWRRRGDVPLSMVPYIAKKFSINGLLLNYKEVTDILESTINPEIMSWKELVTLHKLFSDEVKKEILKAKKPY